MSVPSLVSLLLAAMAELQMLYLYRENMRGETETQKINERERDGAEKDSE